MTTHADKTQENKSQSTANEIYQKQTGSKSTFQFMDNRSETIAQRKLQEMVNNSSLTMQLRAFQDMVSQRAQKQTVESIHYNAILPHNEGVIQKLKDAEGVEITEERLAEENNLDTLKAWASLESDDWEDADILDKIKIKITALEPKAAVPSVVEASVVAAVEPIAPTPAVAKPKKKFEGKQKEQPKSLPPGWVYKSALPAKGGTNKTRSWGNYPHVSVLLGNINVKDSSVKIEDIHYSFGESDTHFHWISKGNGVYEFNQDTGQFTQQGLDMLKVAYDKVKARGEKLGFVVKRPSGI